MNYGRLVAAAAAGTLVDAVYGFLVYGILLTPVFARYPAVYRPATAPPVYMAIMFAGIFVAMLFATAIYAKGYEGRGSGVAEGARFGLLIGLFAATYLGAVNYGTLNIGRRLAAFAGIAGIVEWIAVGITVGAVYKPSGVGVARPPAPVR
jgi:hypothetical protein